MDCGQLKTKEYIKTNIYSIKTQTLNWFGYLNIINEIMINKLHKWNSIIIIAVPTGMKFFKLLSTVYGSQLTYRAPCVWSLGFLFFGHENKNENKNKMGEWHCKSSWKYEC